MRRVTQNELVYYQFEQWQTTHPVVHGVFTRLGGASRAPWDSLNLGRTVGDDLTTVERNHALMYDALQVDGARACSTWLVHSADVVIATKPPNGRSWLAKADALITDRPGLPLLMRYADCVPILFHDPAKGVIGVAHAGWRGTVAGVASNTIRKMAEAFGSRPADVQAAIGPSIGPECYQVGQEVITAVEAYFGTAEGLITRQNGSAHLDLWRANQLDLERAGVQQIEIARLCTACHTHEFYSHRAELGRAGRFGALIALAE